MGIWFGSGIALGIGSRAQPQRAVKIKTAAIDRIQARKPLPHSELLHAWVSGWRLLMALDPLFVLQPKYCRLLAGAYLHEFILPGI